jgi:hypothetical protein
MKNNALLVCLGIGPTYKKRLLNNLKTNNGYDKYDILLITNDVEYWYEIKNKENIFIEDIDDLRKDYPWSIENEKLPIEKRDEIKYAKEIIFNNFKFPTLLERFCFIWKNAKNYDGFIWLNTDVLPKEIVDKQVEGMNKYFSKKEFSNSLFGLDIDTPKKQIVMCPGGSKFDMHHYPILVEYTKKINNKYKITENSISNDFYAFDGNFITYNFPNKNYYVQFFDLINNILKDYFENKEEFFFLGTHTIWSTSEEYIVSIVMKLMNGVFVPLNSCNILGNQTFSVNCYPEDRFWNWGWDSPVITESQINEGQEGFIKRHYDRLKSFYESRGQKWVY